MANVLGDLFQEIADAIRTKTGDTATMVPANFPAEILSIPVVVSGGETETDGNLKIAYGVFYAGTEDNNVRQTIAHGLGEMPDFVFVGFQSATDLEIADNAIHLVSAWGLNSKFPALGSGAGLKGYYATHGCYINEDSGTPSFRVAGGGSVSAYGMDEMPDTTNFDYFAWISTPDDTTFEVGANTHNQFWPGGCYYWIALSGVGATGEYAENLSF